MSKLLGTTWSKLQIVGLALISVFFLAMQANVFALIFGGSVLLELGQRINRPTAELFRRAIGILVEMTALVLICCGTYLVFTAPSRPSIPPSPCYYDTRPMPIPNT